MDALTAARSEVELCRKVFGEDRNGWTRASRALAALVVEIDAAPEAGLCIFNNAIRFREATSTTAIIAMVGKRVRLLALDSGGAGEVGGERG